MANCAPPRDLIEKGLAKVDATIILCADDSLCASLGRDRADRARYFAMAPEMLSDLPSRSSDEAAYCTYCGGRYTYNGRSYGHLGRFHCPQCGFTHPDPDLTVQILEPEAGDHRQGQRLRFLGRDGAPADGFLPIPAAIMPTMPPAPSSPCRLPVIRCLSWPPQLPAASPAFGRMERFKAGDRDVCLLLVKNPVGMDRALEYVTSAPDFGGTFLLLNSEDPDGRDVSWIWDVDFREPPAAGARSSSPAAAAMTWRCVSTMPGSHAKPCLPVPTMRLSSTRPWHAVLRAAAFISCPIHRHAAAAGPSGHPLQPARLLAVKGGLWP